MPTKKTISKLLNELNSQKGIESKDFERLPILLSKFLSSAFSLKATDPLLKDGFDFTGLSSWLDELLKASHSEGQELTKVFGKPYEIPFAYNEDSTSLETNPAMSREILRVILASITIGNRNLASNYSGSIFVSQQLKDPKTVHLYGYAIFSYFYYVQDCYLAQGNTAKDVFSSNPPKKISRKSWVRDTLRSLINEVALVCNRTIFSINFVKNNFVLEPVYQMDEKVFAQLAAISEADETIEALSNFALGSVPSFSDVPAIIKGVNSTYLNALPVSSKTDFKAGLSLKYPSFYRSILLLEDQNCFDKTKSEKYQISLMRMDIFSHSLAPQKLSDEEINNVIKKRHCKCIDHKKSDKVPSNDYFSFVNNFFLRFKRIGKILATPDRAYEELLKKEKDPVAFVFQYLMTAN